MASDTKCLLQGIIPPMITPLVSQDVIDEEGLERLIEHLINGGVHGLFILGTTGEASALSYQLRYDLVKLVCAQVNKRLPVYVGITDTAFTESVKLSHYACEHGADAVVVAPPYYIHVGQAELIEYFNHLTSQSPLPLVLYNMPSCTKVVIEPETVLRIADMPGVIGLKDSSADMLYFHTLKELLVNHPDFKILIGPEELLAESLLFGASGGVCGGANLFPRLYVDLYDAAVASDKEKVNSLQHLIMKLSTTVYQTGQYRSTIIKGIKCALKLMGLCDDYVAEPFHRFREPQRAIIRKHLDRFRELYDNRE